MAESTSVRDGRERMNVSTPDETRSLLPRSFENEEVYDGTFARIRPWNHPAEVAFDNLAMQRDRKSFSQYHGSSMHIEETVELVESNVDPDDGSEEEITRTGFSSQQKRGYFALSFRTPPRDANIGWTLGRGVRGSPNLSVDILIISKTCPPANRRTIGMIHATIRFNPQSGVLVLKCTNEKMPVQLMAPRGQINLHKGESHVLYNTSNIFHIGALCFNLQYDLDRRYVKARNGYIRQYEDAAPPHEAIVAIPQPNIEIQNEYIVFNTLAAGSSGRIRPAIHCRSGNPVAFKEIFIAQGQAGDYLIKTVMQEFEVGHSFLSDPNGMPYIGLLASMSVFCEHNKPGPCGARNERVWIVQQLALHDLSQVEYLNRDMPKMLGVFSDLLQGLSTLHRMGFIHRDISLRNCVMLTQLPAQAAICDFGSTIRRDSSTDVHIGTRHTLAPEVTEGVVYTNTIDVWCMGLVMYEVIFPGTIKQRLQGAVYERFMEGLQRRFSSPSHEILAREEAARAKLIRLISRMLARTSTRRVSAADALRECQAILRDFEDERHQASADDDEPLRKIARRASSTAQSPSRSGGTEPFTQHPYDRLPER